MIDAIELLDLPRRLETVQQRHRQIEDDDVGMVLADGVDERPAVGDARDDVALRREQLLERFDKQRVVVGQDDARLRHGSAPISIVSVCVLLVCGQAERKYALIAGFAVAPEVPVHPAD